MATMTFMSHLGMGQMLPTHFQTNSMTQLTIIHHSFNSMTQLAIIHHSFNSITQLTIIHHSFNSMTQLTTIHHSFNSSEPGHGVVQGNGLPLNYIDNGHQIPYQPYAGAYNTHYPPPDAFAAYGPPPPGGYAPQNLSYAPPAHQNYPHHQSFPPQQPPQAQLHMQSHMVQGYGEVGIHKAAWPPQPHLLPPLDAQKPLDVKQLKPEIKLEPADALKRPHTEDMMVRFGDYRAKAPYDPPSAPGIPKILEVGGDFVHLEWDKPESDGGARIQGYWVDKREVGATTWQRVNITLCLPNQFNCSNLIEGRQYEFRVTAVKN